MISSLFTYISRVTEESRLDPLSLFTSPYSNINSYIKLDFVCLFFTVVYSRLVSPLFFDILPDSQWQLYWCIAVCLVSPPPMILPCHSHLDASGHLQIRLFSFTFADLCICQTIYNVDNMLAITGFCVLLVKAWVWPSNNTIFLTSTLPWLFQYR